jgi:hypothetical protein
VWWLQGHAATTQHQLKPSSSDLSSIAAVGVNTKSTSSALSEAALCSVQQAALSRLSNFSLNESAAIKTEHGLHFMLRRSVTSSVHNLQHQVSVRLLYLYFMCLQGTIIKKLPGLDKK